MYVEHFSFSSSLFSWPHFLILALRFWIYYYDCNVSMQACIRAYTRSSSTDGWIGHNGSRLKSSLHCFRWESLDFFRSFVFMSGCGIFVLLRAFCTKSQTSRALPACLPAWYAQILQFLLVHAYDDELVCTYQHLTDNRNPEKDKTFFRVLLEISTC